MRLRTTHRSSPRTKSNEIHAATQSVGNVCGGATTSLFANLIKVSSNDEPSSTPALPPEKGSRKRRRSLPSQKGDWAGTAARFACFVFAGIGLIPMLLSAFSRSDRVREWAAKKTAALLQAQIQLEASYQVRVQPWPLNIVLENVRVEASDGGSPFLAARKISATPRLFSLLDGTLDLGTIVVEEPRMRVVLRGGKLHNLKYKLPSGPASENDHIPFASVAITNGHLRFRDENTAAVATEVDVDLSVDNVGTSSKDAIGELKLRSGTIHLDRVRQRPEADSYDAVDEDTICNLDARLRISKREVLVRRFAVNASIDLDAERNTRPACKLSNDDWQKTSLQASLRIPLDDAHQPASVDGRFDIRLPISLANRFVDLPPTTGWVRLQAKEVHWRAGQKLPHLKGHLSGRALGIDSKYIAHSIETGVELIGGEVRARKMTLEWGGGLARIQQAVVSPLTKNMPLRAEGIRIDGVTLPDLLNDLDGHPDAWVAWDLQRVDVGHFSGTLKPLALAGPMIARTGNFAVYDRSVRLPQKKSRMAIKQGTIRTLFRVTEEAVVIDDASIKTPRSHLRTRVSLGYEQDLGVRIHKGSVIDLGELSPIVDMPFGGLVKLDVEGSGKFNNPRVVGEVAISNLSVDAFPLGDITTAKVEFRPLTLQFSKTIVQKNRSILRIPELAFNFDDGDADLSIRGRMYTADSGLHMRDFYKMLKLDQDARFSDLRGKAIGSADVAYHLGGKYDRCGGGMLRVRSNMQLRQLDLYGEKFDSGKLDLVYLWDDPEAGANGLQVNVRSLTLKKGTGNILARASIKHGGLLHANVTGSNLPLVAFSSLRESFAKRSESRLEQRVQPEAMLSVAGHIGGTLSRFSGILDVHSSALRLGPDTLPASRVRVSIKPRSVDPPVIGRSRCGNLIRKETPNGSSDYGQLERVYVLAGQLFGGQVSFSDLQLAQRSSGTLDNFEGTRKMVSGEMLLNELNLGAFANLIPGIAFSEASPTASLSGRLLIDELPLDRPAEAEAQLFIHRFKFSRAGNRIETKQLEQSILLSGDVLSVPPLPVTATLENGLSTSLRLAGQVSQLSGRAQLKLNLRLRPVDLGLIAKHVPQVKRASGSLEAELALVGPSNNPNLSGWGRIRKGNLSLNGLAVPLTNLELDLRIAKNEIELREATARAGNSGRVRIRGRAPLDGLRVKEIHGTLTASNLSLPLAEGVQATADAQLRLDHVMPRKQAKPKLPRLSGNITLNKFSYTRPMTFQLDLDQLTGRGRTQVSTYDPEDDVVRVDLNLVAPRPLRISNNLIDMRLKLEREGIHLVGTNGRYGALGKLRIMRGSKIYLQGHDFLVRDGEVEFDNEGRIAPRLDVQAETEYRRYATTSDVDSSATASSTGGKWRIAMHAFGDTDAPQVRFSSDPPLSQDDIVLLLQIGMTRAELERGLAGSLAQSVGLEAISAVTGLNQVGQAVPLIDEFRVGSQYSSRTGRPEPTVSIGKRITPKVRATISSGLGENREVRSNIEWKVGRGLSLQGSYDNVNDISSSTLGNVGVNLRWRLEFE